jgi:hypothetical protein
MDNLAESIRNNLLLRLKSPLIGAFCLSWIFLNLKGITLFILVDTPQRIEMVKAKSWLFYDDFFLPVLISLIYLVAFPVFHLVYDTFIDKYVTLRRIAISRKKISAEIEADPDYIKAVKANHLEVLIKEKENLENQISELENILHYKLGKGVSKEDEEWVHPMESIANKMRAAINKINSK